MNGIKPETTVEHQEILNEQVALETIGALWGPDIRRRIQTPTGQRTKDGDVRAAPEGRTLRTDDGRN